MSTLIEGQSRPAGWIRGARFDLALILGTAALGCAFGALTTAAQSLFMPLLTLDLWLLGFHHVVSTFTRISFDTASFRQYRFHVLLLPILILMATAAGQIFVGGWLLGTVYFYAQGWHYLRQSYGLSRIFERARGAVPSENPATVWVLYLLPLAGVLHRSHQGATRFLGFEVRMLPVSMEVAAAAAALSLATVVWWAVGQARAWKAGRGSLAHTLYILTHVALFLVGYFLIPSMEKGWLAINVWHNTQYILIVWLYNNRRFSEAVSAEHPLLSTLSLRRNVLAYAVICLGISSALYTLILYGLGWIAVYAGVVVMQSLNFHHYIVDAIIWKVRRPAVRRDLGLAA